MKSTTAIPQAIADYIKERFREAFLFEVKSIVRTDDDTIYAIEVTKDDYIHHLKFNAAGKLLNQDADPAFPDDEREDRGIDPELE